MGQNRSSILRFGGASAVAVGILGAALSTLDFAYVGVTAPRVAAQFVRAPQESQSVLLLIGMPHIDPCFLARRG